MDKDKVKINLKAGVLNHPLTVAPEDEPYYREAARLIDERYVAYSKRFSAARLNSEEIMSMVALDIAFKHVKLQHGIDIEPVEKTLQSLISDLEDFNRTR
ncbi:MAG: cell division protein ZapA [Bacteroidales bacterium]|nr:cell division protein ZapA [Bacteroidales bacterium]